jgi:hypothetical protein
MTIDMPIAERLINKGYAKKERAKFVPGWDKIGSN